MNKQECDILEILLSGADANQRRLSQVSGYSLGTVNRSLKALQQAGYLGRDSLPTEQARALARECAPRSAVILAAGYGMRMVPINREVPKALLEVDGQRLIDRLICQLRQAGIQDISVVVGFMKERFDYLIDSYGVKLVVNRDYAAKNNLHSVRLVADRLANGFIVPCDLWCRENPFLGHSLYSWYMVSDRTDADSTVRVSRKQELVRVDRAGNRMIGISYLLRDDARALAERVCALCSQSRYDDSFWEDALYIREGRKSRMAVAARVVEADQVVEINTYEQLRQLDSNSDQLKSDAIEVICQTLHTTADQVTNITVLKKGMTNRSFLFDCLGRRYIMRIPGEGTEKLISRSQEAAVYRAIDGLGICDSIAYMNPNNGYKITEYLSGARVCDPENREDLEKCMEKLRAFHALGLRVDHEFDIFGLIDFYESLWEGQPSAYADYAVTKANVFKLLPYIQAHAGQKVLTHIDAVPDNFLFYTDEQGKEQLRLIDWEYAGMQDPHVDIAMFCIYALYDRAQTEQLIDIYFENACPRQTRIKIYCYIAACGLLWSNWCEYKRSLGVEFGEYSLRQYRYAKDYYRIATDEMQKEGL